MDGNQLATSSLGIVRLWDVGTGRLLGGWSGTTENFVRIGHSLFALQTAGLVGNSLVASAVLPERKSHQRRLILKELLRDRHIPPTRQNPSFILPPLSRRLEAGDEFRARKRNSGIGRNGASCRWRDLRVTLQAHQVGIPGRYRSLAVTEGMPRLPLISAVLTGTHSDKMDEPDARLMLQVAAIDPVNYGVEI